MGTILVPRLRAATLAVLLACLSAAATASPANSNLQRTAIRAGRLVDVDRGVVLQDRWLVVLGYRIESILPGSAAAPAGGG